MSLVTTSLLAPPPHVRQHCRCSRLRFSCCRRSKRHVPHRFRFSSDSRIDDILHSLNTYYSLITWSWEPWAKQRSMGDIDICFVSRYLIYKTQTLNQKIVHQHVLEHRILTCSMLNVVPYYMFHYLYWFDVQNFENHFLQLNMFSYFMFNIQYGFAEWSNTFWTNKWTWCSLFEFELENCCFVHICERRVQFYVQFQEFLSNS